MGRAMLVGITSGLRVWLHDKQPSQSIQAFAADVAGSVSICVFSVPTAFTDEKLSSLAVRPFSMATLAALLAGMLRIDKDPKHAASLRLVGNKAAQLVKAPRVHAVALIFLSPYPVADAVEVFESNPASGAFSQRYHRFGNYMIHVSRKELFFSAAFLQKTLGALGAFLLQLATQRVIAMAHLVDVRTGMPVAVRIKSDVGNSEINADQIGWQRGLGFLDLNTDVQIKAAVAIDQIALPAWQRKHRALFFAADEWDGASSCHCPDRDRRLVQVPREQMQIVDHRASGLERSWALADRIDFRNLGASANGSLSGKAKEQTNASITRGLEFKRRVNTKLSGPLRKPIARRIKRFHRLKQTFGLLWRRLQLNLGNQFHAYSSIRNSGYKLNPRPTAKAVGFFPFP